MQWLNTKIGKIGVGIFLLISQASAAHERKIVVIEIGNKIAQPDSLKVDVVNAQVTLGFAWINSQTFCLAANEADTLHITHIGKEATIKVPSSQRSDTVKLPPLWLSNVLPDSSSKVELNEIVVKSSAVMYRNDTVEYSVKRFSSIDDHYLSQVVLKFPGLMIDRNGRLNYQGQVIEKVKVNGKPMFSGDLKSALEMLPIDYLSAVQVYAERPIAFGGALENENLVLNIKTKALSKSLPTGSVSSGLTNRGIVSLRPTPSFLCA